MKVLFTILASFTVFQQLNGVPINSTAILPIVTVLTGRLDHAPSGDTIRLFYGKKSAKAVLDESGTFTLTITDLKVASPGELFYAKEHTNMYLSPGDSLKLSVDFLNFNKSIKYTGIGSLANNYLAQSSWMFEHDPTINKFKPQNLRTATTTPAQMRQIADSFRKRKRVYLKSYLKTHRLQPDFVIDANLHIDLEWAIVLLEYPQYHLSVAKYTPVLPDGYFNFLQELPLKSFDLYSQGNRGIEENTLIAQFLNSYSNRLAPTGVLSADPSEAKHLYALSTNDFGLTTTRDMAMTVLFYRQMEKNLAGVLAAYPTFRIQNRDSIWGRILRKALGKRLLLQPGQLAPEFTLPDNTGEETSLSQFRGKVIYLDFWGTWCVPCMKDIPASINLQKEFKGRDVIFMYISVGDKKEKWLKVLADEHLMGPASVHLRNTNSDVVTNYQVNAFPTYWLIGRDGRIKTTSAPHPGIEAVLAIQEAL